MTGKKFRKVRLTCQKCPTGGYIVIWKRDEKAGVRRTHTCPHLPFGVLPTDGTTDGSK